MTFFSFFSKIGQKFSYNSNKDRDCDDNGHKKNWWDKDNDCKVTAPKDDCGCDDKFVIDRNTVVVNGTSRDDTIIAGEGDQTVYGGGGNDTIAGRTGNDQLSGGDGNDTVAGDIGEDIICGDAGDDYLLGNRGDDEIYGGKGNDRLYGGEQNDVVCGGYGNDFLSGDEGSDVLYGGEGDDVFSYGKLTGTLEFGNDEIRDFELDGRGRDGDKIQIVNLGDEFDTYAEIMAVARNTADGVLFDFGDNRTLLVEDVRVSDLTSDYFIF